VAAHGFTDDIIEKIFEVEGHGRKEMIGFRAEFKRLVYFNNQQSEFINLRLRAFATLGMSIAECRTLIVEGIEGDEESEGNKNAGRVSPSGIVKRFEARVTRKPWLF